ncbi:MAG: hypothetical protein ACT4NV_05100 [Rhodoferax sp.]
MSTFNTPPQPVFSAPSPATSPARPLQHPPAHPWVRARQRLHRAGGVVLALYALMHLGNHLVALAGVGAHQQAMEALRLLYRHPVVEPVLLLVVLAQVLSGAWGALRVLRQLGKPHPVARVQALSGLVLGSFVLVHVAAVLVGRAVLHLDTNFYYAAAGLHVPPYGWFFAPYYFAGVAALGVHLGCAAWWGLQAGSRAVRVAVPWLLAGLGVLLGAGLVLLMAGVVVAVQVPPSYLATYGG